MQISWNENKASLRGTVMEEPAYSHENHGVVYRTFPLEINRLSGAADQANIIVAEDLLEEYKLGRGAGVEIEGEVRSFNNRSGQGSRLVISVYAKALRPSTEEHQNQLLLAGVLCKSPVIRRTPLGREICDLMLAVNRRYGRADYLPCIAWGSLAERCAQLQVGDGVRLGGRFQSRKYTKVEDGENHERIAYEISVMKLDYVTEEEMARADTLESAE